MCLIIMGQPTLSVSLARKENNSTASASPSPSPSPPQFPSPYQSSLLLLSFPSESSLLLLSFPPPSQSSAASPPHFPSPSQELIMSGEDRSWMDNRRNPNRRGVRPQFLKGLEHFVQFARAHPQCIRDIRLGDGLPSANCLPNVWEKWEAHWGSKKFKRNSEIAKANKNSKEGQGSVHTGGSINFSETWDRAKKKYGDKADAAAAVFMATHTTKGPDGSIKWINPYYQDLFEEYEKRAREEAVEEGSIEPESTERPEFREKLWKTIFLDDKQPKGDRLPGFGPHGAGFFNLPLSSQVIQCFASSSDRSQNVDQETFDDRVKKEVQRQLEIERQEREAANRQLESKIEERIQQEREIAERGFEERLQQFMVQMMQQQPTSGNGSTSSVGQYINLNGGLGCNSQSGGGGRCDSSRGGGRGRRGGHGRGH
ncbi:hypothetical protein OROHE_026444 [Orobanche hederae]